MRKVIIISDDVNEINELQISLHEVNGQFLDVKKITDLNLLKSNSLILRDVSGIVLSEKIISDKEKLKWFLDCLVGEFLGILYILDFGLGRICNNLFDEKVRSFKYKVLVPNHDAKDLYLDNRCQKNENTIEFSETISEYSSLSSVIVISSLSKIEFIKVDDIIYIEADGRCTKFHLKNDIKKSSSKNLGAIAKDLNNHVFYKIHKKYIVNINQISHISKQSGFYCVLKNGVNLPIVGKQKDFVNAIVQRKVVSH